MLDIFELFRFDFMIRALLAAGAVALVAPILGVFVVTRRQSLIADTLSHATLAGAAVGAVLGFNGLGPALIAAILGAVILERLRRGARLPSEAALSIILTGSLALAVVILSSVGGNGVLLDALLGSVLTVTWPEVIWAWLVVGIVALWLSIKHRLLPLLLLDEDLGRAVGVSVEREAFILSLLTALLIATGIRVTGVLLISALLVLPVIAASQVGYGVRGTTLLATFFSLGAAFLGLVISFYVGTAAGATIALVLIVVVGLMGGLRALTQNQAA
jgi:zinc transport system permease protein